MKLFKEQNFEEKGWQVTYRSIARSSDQAIILKTDGDLTEFLGVEWKPSEDNICRVLKLNFSKKRQEEKLKLKVEHEDLKNRLPERITRRITLEPVQAV